MTLLQRDDFAAQLQLVHLQWFAAEDEGRTLDASEHKIKKAREEGRVAKSQELPGALVLVATLIAIAVLGGSMVSTLVEMMRYFIQQSTQADPASSSGMGVAAIGYFAKIAAPVLLIAMVAGAAGNIFQVGFLFTTKPLKPDFKRIMPNLGEYFKRNFASGEALYKLAVALIKVGILIAIAYINISGSINGLMNLAKRSPLDAMGFVGGIAFSILIQSAIILLILSFVDYWFQRKQFLESLKMSPQEMKEERKTYEGDPLIKSRMRARMREILTQNMIRNVPKADVVVTNPTHYAVALQYDRDSMEAPTVLAKGQDLVAAKIREVAKEHNIPILENKPLARALYAEVDIGEVIPEHFYEAVVVVLKQVYRMKHKAKEAV